jgi:hypothetical protein
MMAHSSHTVCVCVCVCVCARARGCLAEQAVRNVLGAAEIDRVRSLHRRMLEERRARGAPSLRNLKTGSEAWQTHYLSLDGEFQRACADIVQKLRAVVYRAGSEEAWQLLGGQQAEENQALTLRCAEYHDVTPGGRCGVRCVPFGGHFV